MASRLLLATKIAMCWALLSASIPPLQSPAQPGRLVINSTPAGALITVNGKGMKERTNATYVVPPGKYTVAVSGGEGNLKCAAKEVNVSAGQETKVNCSVTGWTE
jgi:PEGA domain